MPSARTWWWIGIGTGVTALMGTGLILIGRARQRPTPTPPRRPRPLDTTPPPRKPTIPAPPEPLPIITQTKDKRGSGTIKAKADPQLRYSDHYITLFKLPTVAGSFDVAACLGLRYALDKLTWDSILTPTENGEERLFLLQNLNLRAQLHLQGRWDGDRIFDLDLDEKYTGCPGYNLKYPEVGAYFDNTHGTYPSWGGTLPRAPMPGERWGNGYLPLIGVTIQDGRLKLRLQVAPMVKAQIQTVTAGPLKLQKNKVKVYTAHDARYHYEYDAEIEYEVR